MKLALITFFLFFLFLACKQGNNKVQSESSESAEIESTKSEKETGESTSVYSTSSGKSFKLFTRKNENGLTDITVITHGFEEVNDSLFFQDTDPITKVFTTDLDSNGYDELYLITTSVGSGSYSTIYGVASNNDKSATPVYVPEISEADMAEGDNFQGYMGHDSIYLDQHQIARKFPIYKEDDENCCPTGGKRTLKYSLEAGEASWILKIN